MKFFCVTVLLLAAFATFSESKTVKHAHIGSRGGSNAKVAVTKGYESEENAPEKKDIFDINKDSSLVEGDIIPNPDSKSTLVGESKHWSSTTIPIAYASGLSIEAIGSIEYAKEEYELRTCLSFVPRNGESNYISYDTLSGCYSSVGMVGNSQTISIGNGCERIGTVVHEMMHAIGIYHEQSRTDRDDYVTIELANVDSGKEHNFNKYPYTSVDERRVSYDFSSVMHYGDTSFSNNGQPTIVTKDPAYQDVVGQRRAFSPGDVAKINRMYKCSDTVRYSYSCDFEDDTVCGYVQDRVDTADWSQHQTSSSQPSNYPVTDATSDEVGGSYMLFDTSASGVGGSMYSMRLQSKVSAQCLEFSYHMKTGAGSTTSLGVHVATVDDVTGEIITIGNPVSVISGNNDIDWNVERLTISANSAYKLVFKLFKDQASDVVAVDEISVLDKACETGYFVIHGFSDLLATAQKGDYLYSPLMYTEDGYGYQIKMYPAGTTSSSDGYISLYYSVAMGENDEQLQWPMQNRFIRLSVVDQDSDAVARMSQSNNFVSSDSSSWEKPTSARNSAYGYSSFMPISDITNTRSFVKHDSVMISIEVRDMNSWAREKVVSAMQAKPMTMNFHNDTQTSLEQTPEFGYTSTTAIGIIALSSAAVFILMIIAIFIVNEKNSKQLNKAMLISAK